MRVRQTEVLVEMDEMSDQFQPGAVALLGVPFDANSCYRRGPALAPPLIRAALHSDALSLFTETGINLGEEPRYVDLGDLLLTGATQALCEVEQAAGRLAAGGARLLALGGDHSISYPLVRAAARRHPRLSLLHIDAHPDIRDELDGNRFSHASPFARIMEEGLVDRLVQVGIRFNSPPHQRQIERFGVEVIAMRDWPPARLPVFEGPLYLSLDLDGLDPAFAPGVTHAEPGGLTTREVVNLIQRMGGQLVGADLVEYNPERDATGITAVVAAKLVKEIAERLLET